MKTFIDSLETAGRMQLSSMTGREPIDEYYSDRSRVVYCSSFRRLQQKAQVFSLEPNKSIRTRLTHSIEVSDVGRTLSRKIANSLTKKGTITETQASYIVAVVENACLLHDIGNPPFGHFGEEAIKKWSKDNLKKIAKKACINKDLIEDKLTDFYEFDGNPQGVRTILRLHCERDANSLNLTYPTILATIKYTREAGGSKEKPFTKKAGYFRSEMPLLKKIYDGVDFSISKRYPLVYIMEAADDICFSLSDIADGIEKNIITLQFFLEKFTLYWREAYGDTEIPVKTDYEEGFSFNINVSIPWSQYMVRKCSDCFVEKLDQFINGDGKDLVVECEVDKVTETIKKFSRRHLYRSPEAENIELSGYAVITGLLNHFSALLNLTQEKFNLLLDNPAGQGLDYEWRLFNNLSKRLIKSYEYQNEEFPKTREIEWWLRAHLIIDHISSMTDDFALETYQMLQGIQIRV